MTVAEKDTTTPPAAPAPDVRTVEVAVAINVTANGRPEDAEKMAEAVLKTMRVFARALPPGALPLLPEKT